MPYFDAPPGQRALKEFTIFRDRSGRWIAAEKHGGLDCVFGSRDEAMRFALWQADGDIDRVHVEPKTGAR